MDSLIGDSRAVDRKRSVAEFIDDNRAFTLEALSPFLPADMLFVTLSLLNPESINSTSPTHSSSVDSSWRVCKLYIANAQPFSPSPFSWDTAISFISPAIRKR